MEASAAGLATGGGDAAQATDGAEPQAQEPTLADVHSSLQQFGKDIEGMRDHLASEPWAAQQQQQQQAAPEAEQTPEEMDFGFLNETDPRYQGPEQALAQLGEMIRGEAAKIAQDTLKPVQESLQQERQERGYEDLAGRYPQLQDPAAAKELLDLTAQVVEQEGFPKELALHPGFMEKIYLAARAQQQNAEEGGDAAAATLEGAGGASPGGAGQGGQTAQSWGQQVAPPRLGLFTGG